MTKKKKKDKNIIEIKREHWLFMKYKGLKEKKEKECEEKDENI